MAKNYKQKSQKKNESDLNDTDTGLNEFMSSDYNRPSADLSSSANYGSASAANSSNNLESRDYDSSTGIDPQLDRHLESNTGSDSDGFTSRLQSYMPSKGAALKFALVAGTAGVATYAFMQWRKRGQTFGSGKASIPPGLTASRNVGAGYAEENASALY